MTALTPDNYTNERVALFAGTFDPYTVGHHSVIQRALPLFDRIIIAIGINSHKSQSSPILSRINEIKRIYSTYAPDKVSVISYEHELTVDLARRVGASWLIRGVRSVQDFEYERNLADINRKISGLETIVLFTLPEHACISSSVVRELRAYGHNVNPLIP